MRTNLSEIGLKFQSLLSSLQTFLTASEYSYKWVKYCM